MDTDLPVSSLALAPGGKFLIGFTHDNLIGMASSDKSHWDRWRIEDGTVTRLNPNPSLAPPPEVIPLPPGFVPSAPPAGEWHPPPGFPLPQLNEPVPVINYLLDEWASMAGSFSSDGSQIILSNMVGGIAVFNATTGDHEFTVPIKGWQAAFQHGHRWERLTTEYWMPNFTVLTLSPTTPSRYLSVTPFVRFWAKTFRRGCRDSRHEWRPMTSR